MFIQPSSMKTGAGCFLHFCSDPKPASAFGPACPGLQHLTAPACWPPCPPATRLQTHPRTSAWANHRGGMQSLLESSEIQLLNQ